MTSTVFGLLLSLCFLGAVQQSLGQDSWLRLRGSVGLSSDYYSNANSALPATEPIHRASVNMTLNLWEQIELPFSAYITNRGGASYSQPFSQVGISPKFGNWLQLHAGYFSKQYSEFSLGDVRLLGGGVDLTTGNFKISALYGYSLLARQPDSTQNFGGTYSRRIAAAQIGYNAGKNSFLLSMLHARDEAESITSLASSPAPYENFVSSVSYTGNIVENVLDLSAEAGISLFTANIKAMLMDSSDHVDILESLVSYNSSSSIDASYRLGAGLSITDNFKLRADMRWIGPGFISLGYVQLLNDVMEITLSPSLTLLESSVMLSGSIGTRSNNLRDTKEGTTSQLIASAAVNIRFTQHIGLDASYSNFGMRSTVRNDTLRISNITQFISLTPHINFEALGGMNTASLSLLHQSGDDRNQFTRDVLSNTNTTLSAVHSISFPISLSLTTTAMKNSSRSGVNGETSVTNINESIGYSLFDNSLTLHASLGLNFISGIAQSSQLFARLMASYYAGAWGNFSLSLVNNSYDYSATGALSYSELQGSLQYGISF